MHVILLVIAAVTGLIWAIITLQRELRRRAWSKQNTTPLFSIDDPRELAVVLAFGFLHLGGQPTREEKALLISYFQSELMYSEKDANEMYRYASYVIGTDANYSTKVRKITSPARTQITDAQRRSLLSLLSKLAEEPTQAQTTFLEEVRSALAQ